MKALITYRPDSQKKQGSIRASLTTDILNDICQRITGQDKYSVIEDTSSYNRGRLVVVDYRGKRTYITLSEQKLDGRNSSIQSVPTALNIFFQDSYPNKSLCYYFLEHTGNAFTDYHMFMYRMMATAGIHFINSSLYTNKVIVPFNSVDDIIYAKRILRQSNKSNNSSYLAKSDGGIQIYAKVYGASKYESTLLAFATSKIAHEEIDLYNICERDLQRLPRSSQKTLKELNIHFHDTNLFFDINHQHDPHADDLRSSAYIYNLLNRMGDKQCALCGCPIQEIVQGAHVWNIADIKSSSLSDSEKFKAATSGSNGLWLCQNHHKLFDANLIMFDNDGALRLSSLLNGEDSTYIKEITLRHHLDESLMDNDFKQYLALRNSHINLNYSVTI